MAGDPRHRIDDTLFGWLESPTVTTARASRIVVAGWVFCSNTTIDRLIIRTGLSSLVVPVDRNRPDVAAEYPFVPAALRSGFHAIVHPATRPDPATPIEVWAVLASGVERRVFRWKPSPFRSFLSHLKDRRPPVPRPVARVARFARRVHGGHEREPLPSASDRVRQRTNELNLFLQSGGRLDFTTSRPRVSVVILAWNKAELTYGCLCALHQSSVPLQVIVVDNGSTDVTPALLGAVRGATIIRNASNLGFVDASNQGAAAAEAEYILFLNNDADVLPDAIAVLVNTLERDAQIGAVGGRLVWPSGQLQEAGSIIWKDGHCKGYGRGGHPMAGEYSFRRDVDFCSAALLLTRTTLFREIGGFDTRYRPAYYEDVDYCVRVWQRGYRVTFEPRAVAIHVEFASSQSASAAIGLQARNHAAFVDAHSQWLRHQCEQSDGVLRARSRPHDRRRLLYIDDILPDATWGAGFPRAAAFLRGIQSRYAVTVYTTRRDTPRRSLEEFPEIEVIEGPEAPGLAQFFAERRDTFDLLVISRSHNMQILREACPNLEQLKLPIVYDAEVITALREVMEAQIKGHPFSPTVAADLVRDELALADSCDLVLTVNRLEQQRFIESGHRALVLGHAVEAEGGRAPFSQRETVLFVGAFAWAGPNVDAATYLASSILPALQRELQPAPPVVIVGRGAGELHFHFDAQRLGLSVEEGVADLDPFYEHARVFVAPTRYAAGIPLKIVEAAAHGVPVVCSTLLAEQLGWQDGRDLLVADTPEAYAQAIARLFGDERLWSEIRANALGRVRAEYDEASFARTACDALDSVLRSAHTSSVAFMGSPG